MRSLSIAVGTRLVAVNATENIVYKRVTFKEIVRLDGQTDGRKEEIGMEAIRPHRVARSSRLRTRRRGLMFTTFTVGRRQPTY